MSGHSKWSTIKRKKGAADAKRGQSFTKYANAIALAAHGGADPDTNFKLRLAVDRARAINMPTANIDKAIARGSGSSGEAQLEQVVYEGYGPGAVAVLVECTTDNRNRTAANVRSVFSKYGGNLSEPGAVAYQFEPKAILGLEPSDIDAASLSAIDAGAEEVEADGSLLTIYTPPANLKKLRDQLEASGQVVTSAELSFVPKQTLSITDKEAAQKIIKFMNALEELDDVNATYSNFDIPSEILETVTDQ